MTKLKRPERYVQFESIKPELKEITEFYTRKTADYQYKIKELNEYVDALENEISVLKETPKVEDWQPPKTQHALPVVPEDVDKAIKYLKGYNTTSFSDFDDILTTKGLNWLNDFQFKDRRFGFGGLNNKLFILSHLAITGYTVEKEQMFILKHIDMSKLSADDSLYLAHGMYAKLQHARYSKSIDMSKIDNCHFTQSEIDKLNIGSYEQIAVKVED